jgi:hypothetical protein
VTGTGGDGAVRRATVRITEAPAFDKVTIVPEKRFLADPLWDPAPGVLRQAKVIRTVPVGRAGRPTPQEPFVPKAGPPMKPREAPRAPPVKPAQPK